ncbi:MAG: amidohydrolase, partial [Spirochaetaceae bacterium]|nr:amidohydrolase [Spirochaetaceae bacterium]
MNFGAPDSPSCLFDSHMHLLPLSFVSLSAYLAFLDKHRAGESLAALASPDYIFRDIVQNRRVITNILSVMENTPLNILKLLEDDLLGVFETDKSRPPVIDPRGLTLGGKRFEMLVLTPLIMDFELPDLLPEAYYSRQPIHSVEEQAHETLEAIRQFRLDRPDSRLLVRPYMGINPQYWSGERIEAMLNAYFSHWSPLGSEAVKTWNKLQKYRTLPGRPYNNAFAGIKLYPPLGFDPWPENSSERAKLEMLYDYCERKGIPLITHCDDQGFRALPLETSLVYTAPDRWDEVLKRHPNLYLNIAHFGRQYYRGIRLRSTGKWQQKILQLITDYPNVYTDMSFTGAES